MPYVITVPTAQFEVPIKAPKDKQRMTLHIRLPDRTAKIAAKSPRKAQAAIREAGADNIALALQGRFIAGDVIAEAASSRRPRQPSRRRNDLSPWGGGGV